MPPRILTVTLNPALDITTTTAKLLPQQKLRCDAPRYDPGGGGINVSRVIKELGGESLAFAALGGRTGAMMKRMLDDAGLDVEAWRSRGDTRFSMTVMEEQTGLHYRFVLPGPEQPVASATRLLRRLGERAAAGYGFVVASGSLPPGLPIDLYGRLAEIARANGAKLILDTHGEALRAALPHRPWLIRLNHHEAQELLGGDADRAAHDLARELVERGSAEIAIVAIGERGAFLVSADHSIEIAPPHVDVRSMVGAGDSFVGAMTLALSRGWPIDDATRYGVAAAAAAVTTEATELCEASKVADLFAEMGGRQAA
ncbi:MAG TPA: 1-phosphofructokinase family hexose kinase [Devosia sp.]|nr:1-phosphofructokinase family hexose kinase [Devosia sp.]